MTNAAKRCIVIAATLFAGAVLMQEGLAQAPPPGVFAEVQTAVAPRTSPVLEPATMRSRVVQVDTQQITAARRGRETLKLNLFDDAVVEVQIKRVRPTQSGYFITGRPKGMEWGEVRLVVNGPVMVGTVVTPKNRFTIRSAGSGRHVIRQIDPSAESFDCEVEHAPLPARPEQAISSIGSSPLLAFPPTPQAEDLPTEDGSEIRVLIAYTSLLEAEQGGSAGMLALVDLMIQSANQAFEDSGIRPRLALAHAARVENPRAPSSFADLSRLIGEEDGYMDEIHALRNQYAADLVHLLTSGPGGIAAGNRSLSLAEENWSAFAVTGYGNEWVFVHETGHNLGLLHDRFNSDYANALYPYAFGYVNKGAFEPGAPQSSRWQTIMAYPDRCFTAKINCARLFRFSNPDQTYRGDPLGVPAGSAVKGPDGPADARLTINNIAPWAGSYRSEACTDFDVSPETPFANVGGGQLSIKVDTAPGCLWEWSSQAEFLTIATEARSAGSRFVSIEVNANLTGAERSGIVTIADKTITVRQFATDEGICGRTPAVMDAITKAVGFADTEQCNKVTDNDLAAIESLSLLRRGIDSVHAGDFAGLSNLKVLSLEHNQLADLPEGVFAGLVNLQNLVLSYNRLTNLPEGIFTGLSKLQRLTLSSNRLVSLPTDAFAGISNLESLRLNHNELASLPDGIFAGLSKLRSLNLESNQLNDISVGLLADQSDLNHVRLGFSLLADVPDDLFAGLAKLQTLSLAGNRLVELPAGLFAGLANLERLDLGANRLTDVPDGLFADLAKLEVLSMNFNPSISFPPRLFAGLSNLDELYLNNSQLIDLPVQIFTGLSNLERISLRENEFTELPLGIFAGLPRLKSLDLGRNRLSSVQAQLFSGLSALETLDLESNRITSFPEGVFSGLPSLQALKLRANELSQLPDGIFSGLTKLTTLDLDSNSAHLLTLSIALEKGEDNKFKGVARAGAPFTLVLPVSVSSAGSIDGDVSTITIPAGFLESTQARVTRVDGTQDAVNVNIGELPPLPTNHTGYSLKKDAGFPLQILPSFAPVDASLIDLWIAEGAIDPAFGADTTGYKATVANETASTTVAAMASNANATVVFLDAGDNRLGDADAATEGHQVNLNVGENTITIRVTSEDKSSVQDYTLIVTRDVPANACIRTPQVRDAILIASQDIEACGDVTETHLSEITSLDLLSQNISSLKSGDFAGLTALESLYLGRNYLRNLPPDIFEGLAALEFLGLYDNTLRTLPTKVFSGLTELRTLEVHSNELETLPAGVFTGLTKLEDLRLSGNRFRSLLTDMFTGLTSLEVLRLDANLFITLPEDLFTGLSTLRVLGLENNPLTSLPASVFSNLAALEVLFLSGSRLRSLPADVFSGLTELEHLLLINGQLSRLPNGIFSDLTALRSLGLAHNHLNILEASVFSALSDLVALDLKANNLSSLPDRVFFGLTDLLDLDLEFNAIDPLPILLTLDKAGDSHFKAVASTGAPFTLGLPITISKTGTIEGDLSTVTVPVGAVASTPVRVTRVAGTEAGVTVDLGALPDLPKNHRGYIFEKDDTLPRVILPGAKLPPPAQVGGVETNTGVEQLDVSWTAVSDAGGYKVQWKSGEEAYDEERQVVLAGGETTRYTIAGLTVGTEYTVRVIATKENADDGLPSSEVTGTPTAKPASQVTNVVVSAEVEQLDVSWDVLSDANGYKVQWKSGEDDYGEERQAVLTGAETVNYTITDLIAGREYMIQLLSTKEHADDGPPSDEVTAVPLASPPVQVTGVEVTPGVAQLEVLWTEVSSADGYKVQWKSGDEDYDDSRQTAITGGDTVSHSITGLTAGTEYTVRVIATREHAEDGPPSSEAIGTPKAEPPAQVPGVEVEPGFEELAVSWTAVSEANGYRVQWKSGTEGYNEQRQAVIASGDTISHTITGLTADTEYTIRVIATKDNADDGTPSDEVTATPISADPDVNGDGVLNGDDALAIYHSYASGAQLGDGETGGTAQSRQSLLAGYSGQTSPSDDDLKAMIRKAHAWKEAGVDAGGDINEDGAIDESDAFVMYYAYATANLVGDGETGGTARFRQLLLAAFANKENPTDEDLKAMLRRANKLREEFG